MVNIVDKIIENINANLTKQLLEKKDDTYGDIKKYIKEKYESTFENAVVDIIEVIDKDETHSVDCQLSVYVNDKIEEVFSLIKKDEEITLFKMDLSDQMKSLLTNMRKAKGKN